MAIQHNRNTSNGEYSYHFPPYRFTIYLLTLLADYRRLQVAALKPGMADKQLERRGRGVRKNPSAASVCARATASRLGRREWFASRAVDLDATKLPTSE